MRQNSQTFFLTRKAPSGTTAIFLQVAHSVNGDRIQPIASKSGKYFFKLYVSNMYCSLIRKPLPFSLQTGDTQYNAGRCKSAYSVQPCGIFPYSVNILDENDIPPADDWVVASIPELVLSGRCFPPDWEWSQTVPACMDDGNFLQKYPPVFPVLPFPLHT